MAADKKNDGTIIATYEKAEAGVDALEVLLANAKRNLRATIVELGEAAEARRREHEKALYDMAAERQSVKDGHAREDAQRNETHARRMALVVEAEDELLGMLGLRREAIESGVPAGRFIRDAFAKRLAAAESAGFSKGMNEAKAEATAAAKLKAAEDATASALLAKENETLKIRNADLESQNKDLLANQQRVVGDMKEVATGAFAAAGGVMAAGQNALGTAAGAGQQQRPNGR